MTLFYMCYICFLISSMCICCVIFLLLSFGFRSIVIYWVTKYNLKNTSKYQWRQYWRMTLVSFFFSNTTWKNLHLSETSVTHHLHRYLGTRHQSGTLASPNVSTLDEELWELMHAEAQNGGVIGNLPSVMLVMLGADVGNEIFPYLWALYVSNPPYPPVLYSLAPLFLKRSLTCHTSVFTSDSLNETDFH